MNNQRDMVLRGGGGGAGGGSTSAHEAEPYTLTISGLTSRRLRRRHCAAVFDRRHGEALGVDDASV